MDKHLYDITVSHPTQIKILDSLRHTQSASYARLQPHELSGNEFGYHLKKLITAKLVSKKDDSYSLTSLGRLLSDVSSYETNKLKLRPVSGVWVNIRSGADTLLYESYRAPLFGVTCLPFGKLRVGQTVEESLRRIIKKRGLDHKLVYSVHSKYANVQYMHHGEIVAHRCGLIITCDYTGEEVNTSTKNGSSYFGSLDRLVEYAAIVGDQHDYIIETTR